MKMPSSKGVDSMMEIFNLKKFCPCCYGASDLGFNEYKRNQMSTDPF